MAEEKKQTSYFVATPIKGPLKIEMGPERAHIDQMATALFQRVADRREPILTKAQDEQFLKGMVAMSSLNYPARVLILVQESDSVKIEIVKGDDD